jgi:hypothetical protein
MQYSRHRCQLGIEHPNKGCRTYIELEFSDLAFETGNPFTSQSHDAELLRKIIVHSAENEYLAQGDQSES